MKKTCDNTKTILLITAIAAAAIGFVLATVLLCKKCAAKTKAAKAACPCTAEDDACDDADFAPEEEAQEAYDEDEEPEAVEEEVEA